ncbi:Protein CDO-1 [Aphelenchoides avenae]|nr:Protein CDO-1 [Aphelenchus avenae]
MEKLIEGIRGVFEDDHINTEDVRMILEEYTRNLVDVGNGKYNMLILCWGPGMGSSIHDHTDSHCFVKVLQGQLLETRYAWPDEEDAPMVEIGHDIYETNGVTYMSDKLGLHRMENPSHSDGTVSLHLYIPPFDSCQVFDERTGRKSTSLVTFYTKYGEKVDYRGSKQGRIKAA